MSRGWKVFWLSLTTLAILIAVGQFSHHADPGGTKTGQVLANNPLAPGVHKVPLSAAGMQALATQVGHCVKRRHPLPEAKSIRGIPDRQQLGVPP